MATATDRGVRYVKSRVDLPWHIVKKYHFTSPAGECGELIFIWASRSQFDRDRLTYGALGWREVQVGPYIAAMRISW